MDRKKLEEAIKWARGHGALPSHYELDLLADAAEAHLATLPKKVKVGLWAVVERDGTMDTVWDTKALAEAALNRGPKDRAIAELTGEAEFCR